MRQPIPSINPFFGIEIQRNYPEHQDRYPLLIESFRKQKERMGPGFVEAKTATHPRSFTASSLGTATSVSVVR